MQRIIKHQSTPVECLQYRIDPTYLTLGEDMCRMDETIEHRMKNIRVPFVYLHFCIFVQAKKRYLRTPELVPAMPSKIW